MNDKALHHYNTDHDTTSARQIVPFVLDLFKNKPTSIIDIGCGLAQWLQVFKEYGVEEVLGVDGFHVPLDKLNIEPFEFVACDLRRLATLGIDRKFDLLLCLEVAEHLEPQYANEFIHTLTFLSDRIIFSAAVPNQTGENHFNEQYPDYWASIFSQYGYSFFDPFREKFWQDEKVNWWYRQNMFLVINNTLPEKCDFPYNGNIYIHPKLLEMQSSLAKNYKKHGLRERVRRFIGIRNDDPK